MPGATSIEQRSFGCHVGGTLRMNMKIQIRLMYSERV